MSVSIKFGGSRIYGGGIRIGSITRTGPNYTYRAGTGFSFTALLFAIMAFVAVGWIAGLISVWWVGVPGVYVVFVITGGVAGYWTYVTRPKTGGHKIQFWPLSNVIDLVESRIMGDMVDKLNEADFVNLYIRWWLWQRDEIDDHGKEHDHKVAMAQALGLVGRPTATGSWVGDVGAGVEESVMNRRINRLQEETGGIPNPREIRAILTDEWIPAWEKEIGHAQTCCLAAFLIGTILPFPDDDPDPREMKRLGGNLTRENVLSYIKNVTKASSKPTEFPKKKGAEKGWELQVSRKPSEVRAVPPEASDEEAEKSIVISWKHSGRKDVAGITKHTTEGVKEYLFTTYKMGTIDRDTNYRKLKKRAGKWLEENE